MKPQQSKLERKESLETAFNLFNQLSAELSGSYRELQLQVLELSQELAAARNERMLQLAEKEQLADRLERLLETLPAAVIVLDQDGCVQEYNPAASRLLEAIRLQADWQQLLASQSLSHQPVENELHLRNGKILSVCSSRLEQVPGRILVMLDVSETRKLQQRLTRQERLSAMGQMSAQLAHQMRTPLSSALLYVSHLANEDLSQEQRERFTTKLRHRLQHMEAQISDILLFARGGVEGMELISLSTLIEEFADNLAAEHILTGCSVEVQNDCPVEPWIMARKDALQGVLSNLADNALQHGADHIRLTLDGVQPVRVGFRDNGAGVPAEYRQQIFEPFFTTRSEGTGLGLSVAQNLMLNHNAEIRLLDDETGDTVFELTFPAASAQSMTGIDRLGVDLSLSTQVNQARSLS